MADDNTMSAEWRALVISKLDDLDRVSREIRDDIYKINLNFVKRDEFRNYTVENEKTIAEVDARLAEIETLRSKIIGAAIVLQALWALILWYFSK